MPVSGSGGTRRVLLMSAGWVFVALGAAGAVLPLMPATPFFLLAAWCFAQSSPRFHAWLMGHPVFGQIIAAYRDRQGISARHKAMTLVALWLAIGLSAATVPMTAVRVVLILIAIGVTIHILRMRTRTVSVLKTACHDGSPEA